jgi:glutamate-1-semialdehyde 2,1-aminomutase
VLGSAGSGVATLSLGESPGIPRRVACETLQLRYNYADGVRELFAREGHRIACVVVEPIAGNMGVVPGSKEFLTALRECTRDHGALLLFDEVMTGFRVSHGGAQELTGVTADICTFGKVIGGGLPVAAYAAPRSIMRYVAPEGPVYQAGTLAGNPVGMAAGLATLALLDRAAYDRLEQVSGALQTGIERALQPLGNVATVQRIGSMMTLFVGVDSVADYDDAQRADHHAFAELFRRMRRESVLIPPSGFEAWFVSLAHGPAEIESTIEAFRRTLG